MASSVSSSSISIDCHWTRHCWWRAVVIGCHWPLTTHNTQHTTHNTQTMVQTHKTAQICTKPHYADHISLPCRPRPPQLVYPTSRAHHCASRCVSGCTSVSVRQGILSELHQGCSKSVLPNSRNTNSRGFVAFGGSTRKPSFIRINIP